jgi:hypothetical protein
MYMEGGVCQGVEPNDTWFYRLNPNPSQNTWTRVSVANVPVVQLSGSMEYSPGHDVIVLHGSNLGNWPRTYVFCPVTSGESLSASQIAAGCTAPNDWAQTYAATTAVEPPQSYFTSLVHVPAMGKMFHFGHYTPRGEVWAYDIQTKSWTNHNPSTQPSEPNERSAPERAVAYISSGTLAGKVFYQQTSHNSSTTFAASWIYDPATNVWSRLNVAGVGPQKLTYLAFDPSVGAHGTIIAYSYDGGMWHGTIQAP